MLKDEAFHFVRLGTFLERADNTARILDVKFHGTAKNPHADPHVEEEEQFDFYYWAAILRSISGFEIYRKVYRDVITPSGNPEAMPLAIVTTSGVTPVCSMANILPVRPMPDCTSSTMSSMPNVLEISRRRS